MFQFIIDFFKFPFSPSDPTNKFRYVIQFIFKDYPVYMWINPTWWKFLLFPFMIIYVIVVPMDKDILKNNGK